MIFFQLADPLKVLFVILLVESEEAIRFLLFNKYILNSNSLPNDSFCQLSSVSVRSICLQLFMVTWSGVAACVLMQNKGLSLLFNQIYLVFWQN